MANKFDVRHVTICDNNFGMIPRDAKTAELIYSLKQKYNWPKSVSVWTGKNSKERIIEATRLLGETMNISMAVQSMDPKVLENISRANIKLDHYKAIATELKSQGRAQHGEIISPLPGETFASFTKGFSDLLDTDVTKVENHTIQILHGTPYADNKKYIEDHGYNIKSRIVPLDYGKYTNDSYVFDYEKVGVATKDFSFDEYIKSRKITLIANLCFNGNTFEALKKYVLSIGLKRSDWIKYLYKNMDKFDDPIKKIFKSFIEESKSELWDSEEEMVKYYSKEENYKALIRGDMGTNLLAKYTAKSILIYDDIITTIFKVIRNKLNKSHNKENDLIIDSAEKWLRNLYMIEEIFNEEQMSEKYNQYELKIDFDFPGWLSQNHLPFHKFINKCTYKMNYDIEKIRYSHDTKKALDKNYNKARAMARFTRGHLQSGSTSFEKQFQKVS